jgi:ankyrin repeat protein
MSILNTAKVLLQTSRWTINSAINIFGIRTIAAASVVAAVSVVIPAYIAYSAFASYLLPFVGPTLVGASAFIIPSVNFKIANFALDNGLTGLLDFALSFTKLPIVSKLFDSNNYRRLLDDGKLNDAIENGNFDMAKLLIKNNVDINRQHAGKTPLENVLNSTVKGADSLALSLINKGASLNQPVTSETNLFFKIIKSGKKQLIQAALAHCTSADLGSKDIDGNSIWHIAAANPKVKALLDEAGKQPSAEALNAANTAGKMVLDIALVSYKNKKIEASDIAKYIELGAVDCDPNHMKFIIEDAGLKGVEVARNLITKTGDKYLVTADGSGEHILAHAIKAKDDDLALLIAERTNPKVLSSIYLGLAFENRLEKASNLLYKKCIADNEVDLMNYLRNPTGDGVSALHKFATQKWAFNEVIFNACYNNEKEFFKEAGRNPFLKTDPITGHNLLESALFHGKVTGDYRVAKAIIKIMNDEGIAFHRKVITDLSTETIELLAPVASTIIKMPVICKRLQDLVKIAEIEGIELPMQQVKLLIATPSALAIAVTA